MLKSLRFKHYSYFILAVILVVFCLGNIIVSLRTAKATEGSVTITSPSGQEEINQETREITGTAPALKEVAVFDGSNKIGTTTSSSGGTWSIQWQSPSPGQHSLRAYVSDGTLYKSSPLGEQSVKAQNINSTQITQSYGAGLSGSTGVVYDAGLHKAFVINYLAGTISQLNPLTQAVEETITYNSEPSTDSLSFTTTNPLCRADSTNLTSCAYTYNQQAHKLYILESGKSQKSYLYIVNTQNRSIEGKVEVQSSRNVPNQFGDTSVAANQSYELDYKLYLDPQNNFIYIYHGYFKSIAISPDQSGMKIERVNLQTKELDNSWDVAGSAIVSSAAGDVFFTDYYSGEPLSNTARQNIKVLRVNQTEVESVDVPNGDCDYQATDLALSKDESYLYAACRDAGKALKTVAIDTSDGQVDAVLARSGPFLTKGNLESQKLLIAGDSDTTIQVVNTQNNTLASSIQPIAGTFQERSMVVDGTNEKLFFATLDDDNAQNHHYEVDLTNSSILNDRTYPITDFNGVRSAAISDLGTYLFLPIQRNESLRSITLSSGGQSLVESGMGSSKGVVYAPAVERLFSIPADTPIGQTNKISVASTVDGAYESKITLPGDYTILSMTLNESGSTLYVHGVDYGSNGSGALMKIFAVDTTSLQVNSIFNSLSQYAPTSGNSEFGQIKVNGSLLVVTDGATIYALDLMNDTARTASLNSGSSPGTITDVGIKRSSNFPLQDVAISQSGALLAVLKNDNSVVILNASDLNEVRELNFEPQFSNIAIHAPVGVMFTTESEVVVTSGDLPGPGGASFFSVGSGGLTKEILLQDNLNGFTFCLPSSMERIENQDYILIRSFCIDNLNIAGQESTYEIVHLVDPLNKAAVYSRTLSTSTGTALNAGPQIGLKVSVISASKQVTVRADAVTISSPTEGQKVQQGETDIVGTAPPNASVVVLVDQAQIGTVQADEYGAWKLSHAFSATKTYKITANYTQASQHLRYLNSWTVFGSGARVASSIYIQNTDSDTFDGKITLPDGYISNFSQVSSDGASLLVVALKLNAPQGGGNPTITGPSVFKFRIADNQLVDTIALPGEYAVGNNVFSLMIRPRFSSDETKLYVPGYDGLRIYSLENEQLIKTIAFNPGEELSQNQLVTQFALAENAERAYIGFNNRVVVANLTTDEVTTAPLPDNYAVFALEYDQSNNSIISVISSFSADGEGGGSTAYVNAIEAGASLSPKWDTSFSGSTQLIPQSAAPSSGFMYIWGSDIASGGVGVYAINTNTGEITPKLAPRNSETTDFIASAPQQVLEGMSSLPHPLVVEPTGQKVYFNTFLPFYLNKAVSLVTKLSEPEYQKVISLPENERSVTGYTMNTSDKPVVEIPGALLTAERNFIVGYLPTVPPVDPPVGPPVVTTDPQDPPANPEQPSTVVGTKKENKTSLIKRTERAALTTTPFTKFFAGTKRLFRGIPRPITKALPYVAYTAILALAGYYLYQTQGQLRREDRMRRVLTKQKTLAEEKRNFLELTSHYLRTPLTYIRSGAEIAERNGQNPQLAGDLSQSVGHLSLFIESLIEEAGIQKNPIEEQQIKIKSPLLSKSFLFPAVGLVATLAIFYLLTSGVAGIRFESTQYFTHLVFTILVIRLLYGMIKNHRLVAAERDHVKLALDAERELDHARSKLLEDAGEQLKTRTDYISGVSQQLSDETSKRIIQQGIERLQELARAFRLVCKLEAQALVPQVRLVTAEALVSEVIEPFKDEIAEKKLTLNVTGVTKGVILHTNKPLAQLTLRSLIENAIQASKEGDSLVIKCLHSDGHTAFQVIDHGEGIPKDKLAQLFKPFVRIGPVTTFNREGIGLSLFLDRLIMHSLGGEVEIMSKFEQGTVATLTFNTESPG